MIGRGLFQLQVSTRQHREWSVFWLSLQRSSFTHVEWEVVFCARRAKNCNCWGSGQQTGLTYFVSHIHSHETQELLFLSDDRLSSELRGRVIFLFSPATPFHSILIHSFDQPSTNHSRSGAVNSKVWTSSIPLTRHRPTQLVPQPKMTQQSKTTLTHTIYLSPPIQNVSINQDQLGKANDKSFPAYYMLRLTPSNDHCISDLHF